MQSTKEIETDTFPEPTYQKSKANYTFTVLVKNVGYIDFTRKFPQQPSQGNNHSMVTYDYDSSAILVEPVKNREASILTATWEKTHKYCINSQQHQPTTYQIKKWKQLNRKFYKYEVTYEKVPHNIYGRNTDERAIPTFKNYSLAELASIDPLSQSYGGIDSQIKQREI